MTPAERTKALDLLRHAVIEMGEEAVSKKLIRKRPDGGVRLRCEPHADGDTRYVPQTYTASAVRQVIRGGYGGNQDHLLSAAMKAFGQPVTCPCTGIVQAFADCVRISFQPPPSNHLARDLWWACKTCQHRPVSPGDFEGSNGENHE